MEKVVIETVQSYELRRVRDAVERMVAEFGGPSAFVSRGDKVLLKPNMLSAKRPEKAVTTHPAIVEAVAGMLRDLGCRVMVGDSPGIGNMQRVAEESGIRGAAERAGAIMADFDETAEVDGSGIFKKLVVSRAYLEADAVINLPKLKTHEMMTITCAVKNLFGAVVGPEKAGWHLKAGTSREQFARLLIEIAMLRPVALTVVDGITAMEGNGPGSGRPFALEKLIAGANMFSIDVVAARIAGISSGLLWVESEAVRMGIAGSRVEEVDLVGGEWGSLCSHPFDLPSGLDVRFGMPPFLADMMKHHLTSRPVALKEHCTQCGICRDACPPEAITISKSALVIDHRRCIRCWCCRELCPCDAMGTEDGIMLKVIKKIRR